MEDGQIHAARLISAGLPGKAQVHASAGYLKEPGNVI